MDEMQKDFRKAWDNLKSKGEMCRNLPNENFTPVGIRKNVKETGLLYHGTKADLKIGDLIKPGYPSNYGKRNIANFVYLTALKDGAALAAELALGEGCGRVYIVEPTGSIEDDPNVTDKKFPGNPTRSYRTHEPLRVIGECKDWHRLPEEVLNKIRQRLKEAAENGIEAINE